MFIEVKETVPADGETEVIDVAGVSVKTLGLQAYSDIESRPQFSFETEGGERQRIFEGGIYQNDKGKFNQLILHGSATAEGDEIYFYITPACLEPNIPTDANVQTEVSYKNQFSKASTDSVQTISALELQDADLNLPTAIYVCARTADIAYAIGSNPDQTDEGKILKADGEWDRIGGTELAQNFNFISATGATPANLIILPVYE